MCEKKNFWLAGFFDGEGSCSFSQMSPSTNIVNSDPKPIAYCLDIFRENGIEAKLSRRIVYDHDQSGYITREPENEDLYL